MARHAEGWRLTREKGRDTYAVRFRDSAGKRIQRSTGHSDPTEAAKAAARIYAAVIQQGGPPKRKVVRKGTAPPLDELFNVWLGTDSTIDDDTRETWFHYTQRWLKQWPTLDDVTDVTCSEYTNTRLLTVQAVTVRKENGALRRFVAWCTLHGYLSRTVNIPFIPKKTTGTVYSKRRRVKAAELQPDQIKKFLGLLPQWSKLPKKRKGPDGLPIEEERKRFPIQARFIVQYETGLRPGAIEGLSVPTHYTRGATILRITRDIDKIRWDRDVPLTQEARRALDEVCPDAGPIFGKHDLREAVARAAKQSLPAGLAETFAGAHLRSARITHLLEKTGNIPGVQFGVGHRLASTTAGYTRASFRAAENVFGTHSPNTGHTRVGRAVKKTKKVRAKGGT